MPEALNPVPRARPIPKPNLQVPHRGTSCLTPGIRNVLLWLAPVRLDPPSVYPVPPPFPT